MARPAAVKLDESTRTRARAAIRSMAARLDLEARLSPYEGLIHRASPHGAERLPVLYLEDISEIPFVEGVPGIEAYQHRARVRAGDGDLFVAVTPPTPGYEAYCRRLGLGEPECLMAEPRGSLLAVASACLEGETFEAICARARRAGGLVIHPYMAIETVWTLAGAISRSAGVPVSVVGPPPPILWIANDKNLLSETVERTLSRDWLVETLEARTPAEMARHLLDLASRHARVGMKRTRCASAMGNAVFDGRELLAGGQRGALEAVERFLTHTQWPEGEDVLQVAWEETDLSPSTQLWIPPQGTGSPIVEGIYEQLLEGEEKVFLGSRPSTLPGSVNMRLTLASLTIAEAFQAMGYAGRCSFDFIITGDLADSPRIMFTECNGRWGGTSTPMHLVDRLFAGSRPAYLAQDTMDPALVGVGFDEILRRVGGEVFDQRRGSGRFIFYNVGPLAGKGKLDVISVGSSPQDAEQGLRSVLPRLLGVG